MMWPGARSRLSWAVNGAAILLVLLWIIPTVGLLVSSFRDRDAIVVSGWWKALSKTETVVKLRAPSPELAVLEEGVWVLRGNLFQGQGEGAGAVVSAFGLTATSPTEVQVGVRVSRPNGVKVRVLENGDFTVTYPDQPTGSRGQRIFVATARPPSGTLANYREVLRAEGMGRAFLNTLAVTLPATVLPVLIAAFAAYALAWMKLPGRALLMAGLVALLVVPLQVALIPLLKLHNGIGLGKSYLGIWLAHTAFGLPLAIYILRSYMAGLPRDIIDNARLDGASEFQIFRTLILPLSFPALASFSIFQFLWVWNDLLVAKVFLGSGEGELVMTGRIIDLMGSRGGDWDILAAAAFVSISVPLVVFFLLQRYLVRGLLVGAVKGG